MKFINTLEDISLFLEEKSFTEPSLPLSRDIQSVLAQVLEPHLSLKDRRTLTQTSGIFRGAWLPRVKSEELMHRVLWNNRREANALLEQAKNHNTNRLTDLLCHKVTNAVAGPSGEVFSVITPFQAALCTWNTILCALFQSYFEQIPAGLKAMQAQIKTIFPKGIEAHIKGQKEAASTFKEETLRPLIDKISAASTTDVTTMLTEKQSHSELGQAMTTFREKINALSVNHAKDPVSNSFYLKAAWHLYEECFNLFTTWDQRKLFCLQVIGFIQCYSSAVDLQASAQGLYYLVIEKRPFLDSFKFTHSLDSNTHLEIKIKDFSGLGFDYFTVAFGIPEENACYGEAAKSMESSLLPTFFFEHRQKALQGILCGNCNHQLASSVVTDHLAL